MRQGLYFKTVTWTAVLILMFFYLQLLTGFVSFKGTQASKVTLGLLSSEVAHSFHVNYAPILLTLLFLGHGLFGLQVWVRRRKSIDKKGWWELAINIVGVLLALQLFVLYFM